MKHKHNWVWGHWNGWFCEICKKPKPQASELPSDLGKSQIICSICKGIFSRDKNHTCICHKIIKGDMND